jgi:hypothetical protein
MKFLSLLFMTGMIASASQAADLKPMLWNMYDFSAVNSNDVQISSAALPNYNIQTIVTAGSIRSQGGYVAIPQRSEVVFTDANREKVQQFTSVDRGINQTVTLDKSGKIASLTMCQGPLMAGIGGCFSITPQGDIAESWGSAG